MSHAYVHACMHTYVHTYISIYIHTTTPYACVVRNLLKPKPLGRQFSQRKQSPDSRVLVVEPIKRWLDRSKDSKLGV